MQSARPYRRALAANANSSAFTAKIPTITEPTNDGVLNLTLNAVFVPRRIKLLPIGLGAENDVSSMRLWGWSSCYLDGKTTLWVPSIIGEWVCTFSTAVGVAGGAVLDTERFADTIAPVALRQSDYKIAAGTSINSDFEIFTPANDTPGYIIAPIHAFEKIEFDFDQTTNTPTQNVLYAFLDDDER